VHFSNPTADAPQRVDLPKCITATAAGTLVHKRIIEKGFGGKNFLWLRDQNKLELTSEWFIARHAPELVNAETRAHSMLC
jgi:hypothetical protein